MRAVPAWLVHGVVIFIVVCASIIGICALEVFLSLDLPTLAVVFAACLLSGCVTAKLHRKDNTLPSRFQIGDRVSVVSVDGFGFGVVDRVIFAEGKVNYAVNYDSGGYSPVVDSLDVQPA